MNYTGRWKGLISARSLPAKKKRRAAMFDSVYHNLIKIGYTHPLHPTITHLTIGLVMAAFIFLMVGYLSKRDRFFQTARHIFVLTLATLPITVLLGYMDWQHFYKGAWLLPFQIKFLLAGLLLIFLIVSTLLAFINQSGSGKLVITEIVCLLAVIGLGFFGGELVYGPGGKTTGASIEKTREALANTGNMVFENNCSACHYIDRTDEKVGPGLKGLFQMGTLPVSGQTANEESIRKQLATPYKNMPEFKSLSEEEVTALIAFLETI